MTNRMLAVFVCASLCFSVAAQTADECAPVLQLTGNNITIRESSEASTAVLAQQFCDERYQYMSAAERQAIDASYKIFAASYGSAASSVQEFRSRFCSAGQQTFTSGRSVSEYARQAYAAAVEAWRSCDALRKERVLIVPAGDDRSVTYTITNRTGHPEELVSVISSPADAFQCKAISADGAPVMSVGSRFVLQPAKPFSVSCQRSVMRNSAGAETAPQASVTIVTSISQTPFFMRFPELANPDLRTANVAALRQEFRAAVDALTSRVSQVEGRKFPTSAKPSLGNCKLWSATGSSHPKMCGDKYVMVGLDQAGEVVCCTQELIP